MILTGEMFLFVFFKRETEERERLTLLFSFLLCIHLEKKNGKNSTHIKECMVGAGLVKHEKTGNIEATWRYGPFLFFLCFFFCPSGEVPKQKNKKDGWTFQHNHSRPIRSAGNSWGPPTLRGGSCSVNSSDGSKMETSLLGTKVLQRSGSLEFYQALCCVTLSFFKGVPLLSVTFRFHRNSKWRLLVRVFASSFTTRTKGV